MARGLFRVLGFVFFLLLGWMFEDDCLDTCCFGVSYMYVFCFGFGFFICTCSAQMSMFHMERGS